MYGKFWDGVERRPRQASETKRKRPLDESASDEDKLQMDVYSIYEKISIHIDNKTNPTSPSIYRVPSHLRKVNPSSYIPRVLSIGPFHKESEILKKLEAHKVSCMHNLFDRLGASEKEIPIRACIKNMLEKIERIRSCYEGKMEVSDDKEFAKMMVLDGCFVLELIYGNFFTGLAYKYGDETRRILDTNLVNINVKHDLVLLENQIPFFVLNDIYQCTIGLLNTKESLPKLLLSYLQEINPFEKETLVEISMCKCNSPSNSDYDHILGFLQNCYHRRVPEIDDAPKKHSKSTTPVSYSAADLARAGVKFVPNKVEKTPKSILDMEYKPPRFSMLCCLWGKPTFSMPLLYIEDYTESILRNLIAYEQLAAAKSNHITSYAFAMDSLLDNKEDVRKLVDSNVVVNNLGSMKEASNMINSICTDVTVKSFSYEKQWGELHDYYNSYWPKNVAFLRRTYFSSPWSLIGLLAAFLLFALTAAQTYFTIYPR